MGAKHSFRSPNGGGALFVCYLYSKRHSFAPSCLPSSSPNVNFQSIGANFRQKGAKVNDFLGVLGVFSGKSETKKGKNKNLFYFRGFRCGSLFGAVVVSTGASGAGCRGFRWSAVCVPSLSPCLSSLCCFCFPAIPAKYALFRNLRGFLAWFGFVVWVCVGLVLCVACGAFVCVSG